MVIIFFRGTHVCMDVCTISSTHRTKANHHHSLSLFYLICVPWMGDAVAAKNQTFIRGYRVQYGTSVQSVESQGYHSFAKLRKRKHSADFWRPFRHLWNDDNFEELAKGFQPIKRRYQTPEPWQFTASELKHVGSLRRVEPYWNEPAD